MGSDRRVLWAADHGKGIGTGKLKITGPSGTVTIHEPGSDTRPDLARSSASKRIAEETGLSLPE